MDTPGHFPGNGGFFMRGAVKKLAAVLALACLLACAALGAQNVPATVKATAPGADLAVLETAAPLKVPGLALRTSGFDTGLAVWALGFPGGADTLAGQPAAGVDEMTVTDGIVSAVKTSHEVGTASQEVRLVQTNAAINHGNSGGPMVDEKGNVVGVNTVGVENVQAINGAVHVSELINVLEANGIPYKTQSRMGAMLGAAALALCAAAAAFGLRAWRKKWRAARRRAACRAACAVCAGGAQAGPGAGGRGCGGGCAGKRGAGAQPLRAAVRAGARQRR